MAKQTKLTTGETRKFTQIKISDLRILTQKTDAVIDRNSEPYQEGEYEHATPIDQVKPIGDILNGFDLDPCASEQSALASCNIRNDGGLIYDWSQHDKIWVNPPFDNKSPWLKKAAESDTETVVMLLEANVNSNWYQTYAPQANIIWHPDSRIQFKHDTNAKRPSVYFIFGHVPDTLLNYFERNGHVAKNEVTSSRTINTEEDHTNKLFDDIGKDDVLKLRFNDPGSFIDENHPEIEVYPIAEDVVNQTNDKISIAATAAKDPTAPRGEYIEITTIHRTPTGEETFVVLVQSMNKPSAVYCISDINDNGWKKHNIDQIRLTTNPDKTLSRLPCPNRTVPPNESTTTHL